MEINLGVSGRLIMNALVMYDRETESLWSQFLGKAIAGPLAGTTLDIVPSQLLNYGAWVASHPDTLALDTQRSLPIDDYYQSYYNGSEAGVIGESNPDDRLRRKELVLGIAGDSEQLAISYSDLLRQAVSNLEFEGTPLVAAVNSGGGASLFRRTLDGETLTFENVDSTTMTDTASGSVWEKSTGRAVNGYKQGAQLEPYPFILSFWFAWSDFYPDTDLLDTAVDGG